MVACYLLQVGTDIYVLLQPSQKKDICCKNYLVSLLFHGKCSDLCIDVHRGLRLASSVNTTLLNV